MKRLILIIFLTIFLTGCNSLALINPSANTATTTTNTSTKNYDDFSDLMITNADEQLTQNYSVYYLYYFQEACYACNQIKNEVLSKIELLENDKIYLIDVHGVDDICESINVTHTPSIVKIVDHQVEYIKEGSTDVLEVLNSLS
ncbi:MAG: hypothetical protein B6I17_03420 [Tenericutes bacterium 4572_104]|nr:MAG: hypothetical protein B6I17_03420 [Tenericutes bacterium 4572_104]